MNIGSAPTICGSSIKGPSVVGVSATGFGLRPPPFTDTPTTDSHLDCRYARILSVAAHRAAALLQEHCDVVLFANYRMSITKADVGFNKKVARALGSGERVLHTAERPAFLAKNRYGLPDTLPLDWKAFVAAMPQPEQP